MTEAGVACAVITPDLGADLTGYFDHRYADAVLDELFVRIMLTRSNNVISGIAVYDLCFVTTEFVAEIRKRLKAKGFDFADNICFSATHTHTGPGVGESLGIPSDEIYVEKLIEITVLTVERAFANLAPAEFAFASEKQNNQAFLRRYWMKNNRVVTNPGKNNPDIVKPESEFDQTVSVLGIKQKERFIALLVNLANHTDTIGDTSISADWPGRMEKEIQYHLTYDVPVFTLIDCSGDINHFNMNMPGDQTCFAEAVRIGRIYGKQVCSLLDRAENLEVSEIKVHSQPIQIAFRDLSDDYVAEAEEIIRRIPADLKSDKAMTSEDLVSGEGPAARFFALNVLDYKRLCSGKSRAFELFTFKIGKDLAIVTMPGEGFNGISRAIRHNSPFKHTMFITLANGDCGYVPMKECFCRGGYETLPWVGGGPHEKTADDIIEKLSASLK